MIGMLKGKARFYACICVTRKEKVCIILCLYIQQENQRTYQRNTGARSCNCCSGTARRIKYSDYEHIALFIQHAMRMSRIIVSSMACLEMACLYFTCFIKGKIFGKILFKIKSMFWFSQQLCLKHFSF